ncbi:AtaL-like protein [Sorangium sp. So ce854]
MKGPPWREAQPWIVVERRATPGLCTRCDVVEESGSHIVREATIAGDDLREIITFEPQRKVTFFQATGPREGAIINELFEDADGKLQLRFYCYLGRLRGG